jgi:hypothetical protein
VGNLRATGAGEPDLPAVLPAVQIAAALVLRDEGYQGGENVGHGAGRLSHPLVRWRFTAGARQEQPVEMIACRTAAWTLRECDV